MKSPAVIGLLLAVAAVVSPVSAPALELADTPLGGATERLPESTLPPSRAGAREMQLDSQLTHGRMRRNQEAEEEPVSKSRRDPPFGRAEAAERARTEHGGRVLSVRWTGQNYKVKLLDKGEIRTVTVED